jgi:hypothetical protein
VNLDGNVGQFTGISLPPTKSRLVLSWRDHNVEVEVQPTVGPLA